MPTKTYPAVTITATETTTVRAPAFVKSALIECWGGGGRGSTITAGSVGGGGASGGGYSASTLANLTQLQNYGFVVGAGSSSGLLNGSDTTFAITTVVAKGGGSVADNTATQASAVDNATSGTGDIKYNGGAGGLGLAGTGGGGGGEGAATTSNGNNGTAAASGGAGGTGTDGGDGGAGKQSPQGNATAGTAPGGGGGGAYRTTSGTRVGGTGGNGQARYAWTVDRKDFMMLLGCG